MNTDTPRTDAKEDQMHWTHWLYIVPLSFALSPIGTCFIVAFWKLDFIGALIVIALQFIAYLILGLLSNWGE
jgi:hypothetical protein